ncbi:hypothetical protein ABA45_05960 [Marinobacter psychrophilus]|uniref:Clp R domain-containing protein n=1 Tax=Marinobacter psychrophilus TaxID=330734 RepID=A0A0H4IAF5_9GAMM|nr:hypothetical protein [Marinobacter psychrophilus]AKO52027.1 hypothetical protein ABA45_05960 [Marinobacter psychrophilus]
MEDWQGCLAPQCQNALANARALVLKRGGAAITVEDFLLALLDSCQSLSRFLTTCSIDLDELTRTVQCEQPVVTGVSAEGLLSSQLVHWFARARELNDAPWLDWPVLLQTLTHKTERLQEKAYVAVLERVSTWPPSVDELTMKAASNSAGVPMVVAQVDWIELAHTVAVDISTNPKTLLWVKGPRGGGKTCWLESVLPLLGIDYKRLNLRCESDVLTLAEGARHRLRSLQHCGGWPLLVMDGLAPQDLLQLVGRPGSVVGDVLAAWGGPMLLLADERIKAKAQHIGQLQLCLGRSLTSMILPPCGAGQLYAIVVAHQPAIERQWNIELEPAAIDFAVAQCHRFECCPGELLVWFKRAAASLNLFALRGSSESVALAAQIQTLECQRLVAHARQSGIGEPDLALEKLVWQQQVAANDWHQRHARGSLRKLGVADLQAELKCRLAANLAGVHTVHH